MSHTTYLCTYVHILIICHHIISLGDERSNNNNRVSFDSSIKSDQDRVGGICTVGGEVASLTFLDGEWISVNDVKTNTNTNTNMNTNTNSVNSNTNGGIGNGSVTAHGSSSNSNTSPSTSGSSSGTSSSSSDASTYPTPSTVFPSDLKTTSSSDKI